MAVEYTFAPRVSYKAFLGRHYHREHIDITLAKGLRSLVGPLDDIFRSRTDALVDAVKDIRYFLSGNREHYEVVTLNLWRICGALQAEHANSANGFQALFVDPEQPSRPLPHLAVDAAGRQRAGGAAGSEIRSIATDLMRRGLFAEALSILKADRNAHRAALPPPEAFRRHYLCGVLMLGVTGQPGSLACIDLKGAEAAFLAAGAVAGVGPFESAQAHVGAGKAAYARGRLRQAERRYRRALAADPQCPEAHYQIARLRMHAKDAAGMRPHLAAAVEAHWSFALRFACDPLFVRHQMLAGPCLDAIVAAMDADIRARLAQVTASLEFLRRNADRDHPLDQLAAASAVGAGLSHAAGALPVTSVKQAALLRRQIEAIEQAVVRLGKEYWALLKSAEERIARRGVHHEPRPAQARLVAALAGRLEACLIGGAALLVAAALVATVTAGGAPGSPTLRLPLLGMGFGALALLLAAPAGNVGWRLHNAAERLAAAVERRADARARGRIARNRRKLVERLAAIARRFGIDPGEAAPSALVDKAWHIVIDGCFRIDDAPGLAPDAPAEPARSSERAPLRRRLDRLDAAA